MNAATQLDRFADTSLAEIASYLEQDKLPPVDSWHPSHCGHSGIRIARDGTWYHDGGPIRRRELVRLFSRILRREPDGRFVLVTPAEMLDIEVEDAPFVAVELNTEGSGRDRRLAFRLNSDDPIIAGPANPIRVETTVCGPRPTVDLRRGLEALIARPVYYELAELALEEGAEPPGLWSSGCFFALNGSE